MTSDRLALDPRGTICGGRCHPGTGPAPRMGHQASSVVRANVTSVWRAVPYITHWQRGVKIARSRPTATIFPILWWGRRPTTTSSASRADASRCAGSGLPMPHRRTFTQGILPFAHSMPASLSASCLRSLPTPALGHGPPLTGIAADSWPIERESCRQAIYWPSFFMPVSRSHV